MGGKLVSRAVDVGATVKKGQLLAQLDQTDQQLGVDAARGAVPAAQSDLDRSRSEEARFRDLLERGLTTRAQYQAQQTAVRSAEAKLSQATAELSLARQRLGYTTLRAGEDGVVTRVLVEVGTVVAAGQRALSIARPSELEAVFDVPDGRIEEVKSGSSVLINPLGGDTAAWAGRVREISPSADPVTRTYQVRTTIVNPPASLRLGMTVSVTLPRVGGAPNISLPSTAIFQKDGKPAVWIVTAHSTVELRPVTRRALRHRSRVRRRRHAHRRTRGDRGRAPARARRESETGGREAAMSERTRRRAEHGALQPLRVGAEPQAAHRLPHGHCAVRGVSRVPGPGPRRGSAVHHQGR